MYEIGRRPRRSIVAGFTVVATRDMSLSLAGYDGTIVAAVACTENLIVIDSHDRLPIRIAVATLTHVGG